MTISDSGRCPNCFRPCLGPPCPHCGWQVGQQNPPPALALGEVLDGRYRIGRVLGQGGFGITYLAWDENLQLRLAIKEYLPRDSASRAPNGVSLAVYSGRAGEQFAYGLDRFLDEARALAHFVQHPGIVTVTNFFRANGTGYCVMDYVEGITLGHYLEQQPEGRIGVEAALRLLTPVMDALRAVHKEGLLHRDLAPDNIYISRSGRIKLLDFGAARFAAGEHSKSLSIILKPGYAPEEQYRTKGRQGPWTDVYGLAATFYRAITGQLPPESLDRIEADDLAPPSDLGVAIQPGQESVLLKALAVRATQRYQSITEFQRAWSAVDSKAPAQMSERVGSASPPSVKSQSFGDKGKNKLPLILASAGLFAILAMVGFFAWQDAFETGRDVASAPRRESTPTTSDTQVGQMPAEHPSSATIAATAADGRAAYDRANYEQALAAWRPLAEAGDPNAQFGLGTMLLDGRGIARDEEEAMRWLRKAAEQGIAEAQAKLEELAREHPVATAPDTQAPSPAAPQLPSPPPAEQSPAESIQSAGVPQGRADTEASSWRSDWGNDIQATAQSTPCAVNEFKDQGYQYNLSVDIPITRLRDVEDAWVIAGDRAQTVQGCWFRKDDGLAHAKMIRKKDQKVWEQDLNFGDGSWHSSGAPRQENLPATPPVVATSSFDCGKAKTRSEKAICANKELKALDDQMATAYQEVKRLSTPGEAKMLVQAQRNWIAQRENACSKKAGPQLAQCIHQENSARLSLLLGRQESGAGLSSRIIPIFLTQRGTAYLYELDIQVLRFVDPKGPGERALNAITQSLLDAVPRTPDEDTYGRTWEQRESMRVSYASPRLLSVQADFSSYSGGAHGSSGTKNFNIDLTNGKVLSIEDIFPPSALGGLRRQCREQIIAQKRRSRPTESYDPASDDFLSDDRIATHIAGLDNWSFGAAGGIVSFGEYVIGAYAEGSFECRFPLADLNALALPGAPLPTTNGVGRTAASEKVPIYFAAKLAPADNVPPEAPLCYKFMVSDLDEQLRKLKAKYRSLYGDTILTNPDGSKTLLAKRQDETGKEVSYFYSTSPSACNEYQNNRFGTGHLYPTPDVDALNAGAKRPAAPITDDPIMARINGIAYSLGVFRIFYIERIRATKSEDTAEFQSQVFNEFVNLVITAQEAERLKLNDKKDVKMAIDKQREALQGNENATNAMELERLKVLSSVALQAMIQGFEITESELNKAHVQHTRHTDELVKLRAGVRIELNEDVVRLKR